MNMDQQLEISHYHKDLETTEAEDPLLCRSGLGLPSVLYRFLSFLLTDLTALGTLLESCPFQKISYIAKTQTLLRRPHHTRMEELDEKVVATLAFSYI